MKITIYGAGYVGLVTAVCLAEIGHEVLCFDVDKLKIKSLNQGILPIYEEDLEALLHRNQAFQRIRFTFINEEAVAHADIHMIAVGTPSQEDGSVNLEQVDRVAHLIGTYRSTPCIVVNKSTAPPGTAERVARIITETAASLNLHYPIEVVSNPEFLQEGTAVKQFMNPDRIIIGTSSKIVVDTMRQLYYPLLSKNPALLVVMSARSAELSKYAANALLATKISFINEMSQIAEHVGADIQEIKQGLALDYRINPAFLNAGCGFGGSCFPKDLAGLEKIAKDKHFKPVLISAVIQRNQEQQQVLFKKLDVFFNHDLKGKTIALWGLAFKPNTDDIRGAPSRVLIDALLSAGARIQAFDPLAMKNMAELYKAQSHQLDFVDSELAALHQADALVLVTEWPQFKKILVSSIYQMLKQPVIFDGRNLFVRQEMINAGFYYSGIGTN